MIEIDYSILLSIQSKVQDVKPRNADFLVRLAHLDQQTADPQELIFRPYGSKYLLLTSGELAILEEVNEGTPIVRRRLRVKGMRKALSCTFTIHLNNARLERFINWPRNTSNLPGLKEYPSLKPIYFIDNQRLDQNLPIDKEDLIGLAPAFMRFPIASEIKIRHADTQTRIAPTDTDSQYDQYDLSSSIPGIYTIEKSGLSPQKMYINPFLINRQPLAVLQLGIPSGAFTRKDYSIEFKNKL